MAAEKQGWFKTTIAKLWPRDEVREVEHAGFDFAETLTTAALVGNGVVKRARNRQQLYAKYQQMQFDPVVSGAMRLHVTAALGGHETSGDLVFIEPTAEARRGRPEGRGAREGAGRGPGPAVQPHRDAGRLQRRDLGRRVRAPLHEAPAWA
jgi:hypothetical protein